LAGSLKTLAGEEFGFVGGNQGGAMKVILAPCTRRGFLTKGVKFAGATLIPPGFIWGSPGEGAGGYAPKLSVEAYIWTQHFASRKETLAAGEDEALRETDQAGYSRVELSDAFFKPEVREHTRELLAKFELNPESVYAGTTLHEAPAAEKSNQTVLELAEFLKPLGTRVIITTELRDNAREWWYQLQHTNPKLAGCCVDVHWAYRGGQQVMPFLRRVGARIESLHLRNSQQGVWMEDFGPGDVDYSQVAEYLHQINYKGFLVVELAYEKDTVITRSLEDDLRRSRIYTEKVFGLKSS
jgi:inosose dehydratase